MIFKRTYFILLFLIITLSLSAQKRFQINLQWEEFRGEKMLVATLKNVSGKYFSIEDYKLHPMFAVKIKTPEDKYFDIGKGRCGIIDYEFFTPNREEKIPFRPSDLLKNQPAGFYKLYIKIDGDKSNVVEYHHQ